jgi:hypothetical protein
LIEARINFVQASGSFSARIGVRDDGFVEREIGLARAETARAAIRTLESDGSPASVSMREKYAMRLRFVENRSADTEVDELPSMAALRRVIADQRRALLDLRARDVIVSGCRRRTG